jgi:hypothetical protein
MSIAVIPAGASPLKRTMALRIAACQPRPAIEALWIRSAGRPNLAFGALPTMPGSRTTTFAHLKHTLAFPPETRISRPVRKPGHLAGG